MFAYCENGQCRVVLFMTAQTKVVPGEEEGGDNCPGCGRFGRIKDTK